MEARRSSWTIYSPSPHLSLPSLLSIPPSIPCSVDVDDSSHRALLLISPSDKSFSQRLGPHTATKGSQPASQPLQAQLHPEALRRPIPPARAALSLCGNLLFSHISFPIFVGEVLQDGHYAFEANLLCDPPPGLLDSFREGMFLSTEALDNAAYGPCPPSLRQDRQHSIVRPGEDKVQGPESWERPGELMVLTALVQNLDFPPTPSRFRVWDNRKSN